MRVSDSPAAVVHKSPIIGSDICLLRIRLFRVYQGLHVNTLFPKRPAPPPPALSTPLDDGDLGPAATFRGSGCVRTEGLYYAWLRVRYVLIC